MKKVYWCKVTQDKLPLIDVDEVVLKVPLELTKDDKFYYKDLKKYETIVVPEGVHKLCSSTFNSIKSTSIYLPNTLEDIGDWAFSCSSIEHIKVPSSVTSIGESCFILCTNLEHIDISKCHLTEIKFDTFGGSAIHEIVIPEGVTSIGYGAFETCSNLYKVKLPSTLQVIDGYAFVGTKLKVIVMPPHIKHVEPGTFASSPLTLAIVPSTCGAVMCNHTKYYKHEHYFNILSNMFYERYDKYMDIYMNMYIKRNSDTGYGTGDYTGDGIGEDSDYSRVYNEIFSVTDSDTASDTSSDSSSETESDTFTRSDKCSCQ